MIRPVEAAEVVGIIGGAHQAARDCGPVAALRLAGLAAAFAVTPFMAGEFWRRPLGIIAP